MGLYSLWLKSMTADGTELWSLEQRDDARLMMTKRWNGDTYTTPVYHVWFGDERHSMMDYQEALSLYRS